jgi:hypothetical protein
LSTWSNPERQRHWILPILWTVQIFYFSLLPRGAYPKIDDPHFAASYLQYVYHFGQYFCLSLLVYRAARVSMAVPNPGNGGELLKRVLLIVAVIAFVDELIQIPVPTRTFTLRDLMADVIGGCCGLLVVQLATVQKKSVPHVVP